MFYIDKLIEILKTAPPEKAVLRHGERDLSSVEFLQLIWGSVALLTDAGITRQKLVALLAPNKPEALALRYAAHLLGAATCYLSSPPSASARARLLADIQPDLLLAFPETRHLLPTVTACPAEVLDGLEPVSFAESLHLEASRAAEDDLAVVVSSGGSTGVPKGSCRDFKTYTKIVSGFSSLDRRQLVNGPLAYLSQILVDMTMMNGGYVVLRDRFDAADTLAQIEAHRITDLFLVEPQLFEMMDHPNVPSSDLSTLRNLVHVGASAPGTLRRRASERLGNCLMHTYGASEMGMVSLLSRDAYKDDLASAGHILDGVEVRLRGRDGALSASESTGNVEIRSPRLAQGYRNRPELTAKAFEDGWYRSGDMGRIEADGRLYILGRAADVECIDGVLVTPCDIEDQLCGLPSVRYAVVISDLANARRVAAVEAWPGEVMDFGDCHSAVARRFPRGVADTIVFIGYDRVPRTEQGKPDRARILADAARSERADRMAGE